jgi:PAS domain S-box-containing protein
VNGVRDYALHLLDVDGKVMSWNDGAEHIYGYASAEIVGQPFAALYPAEASPAEHVAAVAAEGRVEFEGWLLRKGAKRFWAHVVMTALAGPRPDSLRGFAAVTRDVTERRRLEMERETLLDDVRQGRERLRYLSRRLLEVQEAERRAVARDLHDEISQSLVAVKLGLESIATDTDGAVRDRTLATCREALESTIHQVRDLSLDLRPALLDDLGLVAALRWQLTRQAERGDFTPRFAADAFTRPLSAELATTCFRIAQEAVANASRHAVATEVRLELRLRGGNLELDVRDDGIGFDESAAERSANEGRSLGLATMRERASLIGGRLEIRTSPSGGTHVRAVLPLDASEDATTAGDAQASGSKS